MTDLNSPKLPQLKDQITPQSSGRVVQAVQDDVVRYANQPIGVVVAETFEAACEGAHLVQVRYAAEKPQIDLENRVSEAYAPKKVGGRGDESHSDRGDVSAGIAASDTHIDQVYWTRSRCTMRWSLTRQSPCGTAQTI